MAHTTGYISKMPENCKISQHKLQLFLKKIIDNKIATSSNNDNFFFSNQGILAISFANSHLT